MTRILIVDNEPINPAVLRARVKTHLKLREKTLQLEDLANRDGLTGLHNRRAFDRQLDSEWRPRRPAAIGATAVPAGRGAGDTTSRPPPPRRLSPSASAVVGRCHRTITTRGA